MDKKVRPAETISRNAYIERLYFENKTKKKMAERDQIKLIIFDVVKFSIT